MLREMLALSRLQMVGAQLMTRRVVDLAGLAQLIVEEEEWSDVEIRGSGTATIDNTLVARIIRNLLSNSAVHAPGHRRWIEVADDTLLVGDDGPGIPPEHHPQATEAFQRGAASTGHGLGLAQIAAWS